LKGKDKTGLEKRNSIVVSEFVRKEEIDHGE
jgi:hypothetical protein